MNRKLLVALVVVQLAIPGVASAIEQAISGHVNRLIRFGDDGKASDIQHLDNESSRTRLLARPARVVVAAIALLALQPASVAADEAPRVRLQTTMGEIVLALDRRRAPGTVESFLRYVEAGFYDTTIFHRVISGFVIQGGGVSASLELRPTRQPIKNEADNGLVNLRGTVAMARDSNPHSATSQFFINVGDNPTLDHKAPTRGGWGYTVFGRVVEGMDVVDDIQAAPTMTRGSYRDIPETPVVIEKALVEPER